MSILIQRIFAVFSFLAVALSASAEEAGHVYVAYTSVAPIATVACAVGAGRWEVRSVVEEGKDPHTFALTPRTAAELSAASAYIAVGIEMDPMVVTRLPESVYVVEVEVPEEEGHEHHEASHEEEHGHDPHVWLDPEGLIATAKAVSAAFAAKDPENAAAYEAALKHFEESVANADARARKILSPWKGRRFFVQHDAFTRFAEHYAILQEAVEEHEKEPTGARLAEVTRLMMADGAKVIFAQPGHNQRPLEVIAKPVGARMGILDPMLPDPVEGLVLRAEAIADSFKAAATNKEAR
jgi:zinc transport system substrate-binding protein